jgi:hypothetical protein
MQQKQATATKWLGAYGRFQSFFTLLFGLIFGVILIIVGYKESKDVHTKTVTATVTEVVNPCLRQASSNNSYQYTCDLKVKYTVDSKEYTETITITSGTQYRENQTVKLYYDPADPKDIVYLSMDPSTSGWLFIGFGIFIIVGAVGYTVLVWRSRTFAAVGGAASLAGTLLGGRGGGVGGAVVGGMTGGRIF